MNKWSSMTKDIEFPKIPLLTPCEKSVHYLGHNNTANKNIAELLNSEPIKYADQFNFDSFLQSIYALKMVMKNVDFL